MFLNSLRNQRLGIRIPYGAPRSYNPNCWLVTSEWFGFTLCIGDLD